MKRSRFTEQRIVGVLKQAESGVPVKELCRKHGISDATFYIHGPLPFCVASEEVGWQA
jgi:putative transposase